MKNKFKIGVCQMHVVKNKEKNITRARSMIKEAASAGCKLVVLPEMFNCPYNSSLFPEYAESHPEGSTLKMLSAAAAEEKIYLVGGSIPERDGEFVYNTSFVFGPRGEMLAKHQKIHLFDVDLTDGLSFHESRTLGAGKKITVVETDLCKLGVAVCYDIRFPELIRLMALAGAEVVILPAAFNMNTGPAHWELLLRTRAVDNQVFLVGASSARDAGSSYVSYGHSVIVDPWGRIIAQADEKETVLFGEIDLQLLYETRAALPLLKHRRLDLYELKRLDDH